MALHWNDVTPDSIAAAKAAQQRERAQYGIVVAQCPKCAFQASALSDGRATRVLASHLIREHWRKADA